MLNKVIENLNQELNECRNQVGTVLYRSDSYYELAAQSSALIKSIDALKTNKQQFSDELKVILENYRMGFINPYECIAQIDSALTTANGENIQTILSDYFSKIYDLIADVINQAIEYVSDGEH